MPRREPKWLAREHVEAIHELQLALFGGLRGIRDVGALEPALARPQHRWHHEKDADLAVCAAAYGFGLARNHAFADGNKRTALVTMAVFVARNGSDLDATEPDAVTTMLAVAAGKMPERELAVWSRANSARPPRRR